MAVTLTDVHITLSGPLCRAVAHDRQLGHAHVMSSLPGGLGPNPRSAAGVLWRVDANHDAITVRYPSIPAGVTRLGVITSTTTPASTGRLRIELTINCQKTPPSKFSAEVHDALKAEGGAYRSRLVIVPVDEREEWITRRLKTAGFDVDPGSITVSDQYSVSLGPRRGGRIPAVDVTAIGTVSDELEFEKYLASGIGKGKNFGLGLIQTSSLTGN